MSNKNENSTNPNPYIAAWEEKYGKTIDVITPEESSRGATFSQPGPDTRSEEQKKRDLRAKTEAYNRWLQEEMENKDVSYYKRDGEWRKGNALFFPNQQLTQNEMVAQQTAVVASAIGDTFKFLYDNTGKPLIKFVDDRTQPAQEQVMGIPGVEFVVGKVADAGSYLGRKSYEYAVKPFIRSSMIGLATPFQLVENVTMFAANLAVMPGATKTDIQEAEASFLEQLTGIFKNTTMYYETFGRDGVESKGLLPSRELEARRAKFEESLRPTIHGQTGTVGRILTAFPVRWGIIEVDDEIHQFLSGGIDASFNIFGDPANWIPLGWLKGVRMLPEAVTAPATTLQIRKLNRAGVILTPEVAAKADEAAKLIDESMVLSEGAVDVLTPKPNILWSGDRHTPQNVIEKFFDIEDPNFPELSGNLVGPGSYLSDTGAVGSTYNTSFLERNYEIDGYPYPIPILDETEGANRLYKFEKPDDFVVVDTEIPWTRDSNVPWNRNKFEKDFGFDKELYDEIIDTARQSGVEITPNNNFTFEQIQESFFGPFADDPLYDYMTRKNQWLTPGQWPYQNRVQTIIPESLYEDFLNDPKLGQYLNQSFRDQAEFDLPGLVDNIRGNYFSSVNFKKYLEINRGSLPTGNVEMNRRTQRMIDAFEDPNNAAVIDEISENYDSVFKQLDVLFEKSNIANPSAAAISPEELKDLFVLIDRLGVSVKNAYQNGSDDLLLALDSFFSSYVRQGAEGNVAATLKRELLAGFGRQNVPLTPVTKKILSDGREVELSVTTSGLSVKGDFGKSAIGEISESRARDSQYVLNRWLAANGVDGARYEGGRIWGGYGSHNAYVVFHPSKLKVIDAITGQGFPTNVAKGMIEAGRDMKVRAEDIAQAAGYKDAVGLVDAWRKGSNPTKYLAWRNTGYAKNLFTAIASQDSAWEIWTKVLKQRSPRLAAKLAQAKTADEVAEIFDAAAFSPDPFEKLFTLPGWSGNVVSELGYRLKQTINKNSRLAATLPQTGTLPLDDLAAGAKYLDDAAVIARLPLEVRKSLLDEYFKIVGQDDFQKMRGELFDFAAKAKKQIILDTIKPKLDELSAPLKKTTEEMTPFERLTMNNRRKIAEEIREFINRNSTWTDTGSDVTRYSLNDIGTGAEYKWLEGNGSGPLYPSQQNSRGFDILPMDPDELDEFVALTERWALLREQAKTIPGMYQASQALDTMLRGKYGLFNAQTLWKKAVLFTGRYIARVVPEEMTRVQFSGVFSPYEMSYVSEIMSGRLNQNIFGEVFPRIDEAQNLMAELGSAQALEAMIARAAARGDAKQVAKLERRLAKIDQAGIQARLDEIDALLESDVASARDVMIGPEVGRAADTILGQNVPGYVKAQTQQVVTLRENPRIWRLFKAQMIIERSVNPAARAVAEAIQSGSPARLEQIAQEMITFTDTFAGPPLARVYQRYFKQQGKLNPDFNWRTIEGAREYVRAIVDDLMQVTDGHPTMLEAIAKGKVSVGDKVIGLGRRTAEGNRPSREFLELMENGDEGIVGVTPFQQAADPNNFAAGYPRVSREKQEQMQGVFSWFMRHAYGRASDKFARVPMFNARKWNLIADMVPMLSKDEAAKLAARIGDYGLPRYVEENVLENLKFAQGKATLKDVDALAGYQTVEETINLLFDSRKRTLFGRNHRLLFPFFDAFREVSAQLMKTAINPLALHKVDKAVRGLENLQVGSPTRSQEDGKQQGFIYKDPTTGQMVWNVPATGQAARALTGIDFGYKITVGSMSMATSVLPGVGPIAAFTYSAIPNRNGETWDRINKYVIPFGEPTEDVREYFTPMFLRRISQGLLEDTPGEGFSRLMFGDPNQSDVYKMMVNRVFMAELSKGDYEPNEQALKQAMQVAQDKANALWFLRGLTQFFAPAAPIAEYYYKTDKDLLPLGVLLEGIRNIQNEVRTNGGTFDDQVDAIIKSFGDDVLPYLASVSETQVPGAEASRAFYDFKINNEELFEKYPDIAGYFGPNTNEFDQEIYNVQRRAGQVKAKNVDDVSAEIQQLWGNLRFNRIKDQLEAVYGTSPAASMGKSILEAQIQQDFPLWNRRLAYEEYADRIKRNMNVLLEAVNDPQIKALPVFPTLQRYLNFRQVKSAEITQKYKLSTVESWKSNKGGIYDREILKAYGDALAADDPAFAPLWNNVLSKEFRTLTPQEMRLAQAGQLP